MRRYWVSFVGPQGHQPYRFDLFDTEANRTIDGKHLKWTKYGGDIYDHHNVARLVKNWQMQLHFWSVPIPASDLVFAIYGIDMV